MFYASVFSVSILAGIVAAYVPVTSEINFCRTVTSASTVCATPTPNPGFACPRPTVTTTVTDTITSIKPPGICPLAARDVTEPAVPCLAQTIYYNTTIPCAECRTIPVTETITHTSSITRTATCPPLPIKTLTPITIVTETPTTTTTTPPSITSHCPPLIQGPCYEVCHNATFTTTICSNIVPTPTGLSCYIIC